MRLKTPTHSGILPSRIDLFHFTRPEFEYSTTSFIITIAQTQRFNCALFFVIHSSIATYIEIGALLILTSIFYVLTLFVTAVRVPTRLFSKPRTRDRSSSSLVLVKNGLFVWRRITPSPSSLGLGYSKGPRRQGD